MKERLIFFIVLVISVMLLCGCQEKNPSSEDTRNTQSASNNEDIKKSNDEQYYLVTEKDGLYSYAIYNQSKEIVRLEEGLTKQPVFAMVNDRILSVTTQAGTGVATSSTFYYNTDTNQFSPIYKSVLAQCQNLVLHANYDKVIIQDIFDNTGYYQEISIFKEPLSQVAFPFVTAEFEHDILSVRVTYLSGEEYKEVSESFMLNQ